MFGVFGVWFLLMQLATCTARWRGVLVVAVVAVSVAVVVAAAAVLI